MSPLAFSINENAVGATYQINATDPNGDAFTFALVSSSFHGTIVSLSAAGLLTLTPTTNYYTTGTPSDTVTVKLTDNGAVPASASYTLTITVSQVYIAPTLAPVVEYVAEVRAAAARAARA